MKMQPISANLEELNVKTMAEQVILTLIEKSAKLNKVIFKLKESVKNLIVTSDKHRI